MARRGRKCGPMNGFKKAASTMQRKATNSAIVATHEFLWGEKPTRKKPKTEK